MPNVLVIGAMKAGTTTIYQYLRQHPDIFMSPVKEPQFFSGRPSCEWKGPDPRVARGRSLDEYQALFAGARGERMRGEASPVYLCDPAAVESIHRHVPDVRLIAILRQPVDRAFDDAGHRVRVERQRVAKPGDKNHASKSATVSPAKTSILLAIHVYRATYGAEKARFTSFTARLSIQTPMRMVRGKNHSRCIVSDLTLVNYGDLTPHAAIISTSTCGKTTSLQ